LKKKLDSGETVHLVDVREDWEAEKVKFPASQLITQKLAYEILNNWDKNDLIVFFCHHGSRRLEAASYFKGHGLPNVKSLTGGIDRYAVEIDPSLPRY
ncbi:MAG: sulfurtransferase, partial [Leptospira sp.]|nr:sulfurtransferase [Leptospira sp.]